jgi:hypothetical protein
VAFDLGKSRGWSVVGFSADGIPGEATYSPFRYELYGDLAVPRKIRFEAPGDDDQTWLTLGIELVDGVPECTYLELSGRPVRDRHLKSIRVEKLVTAIVSTCAQQVLPDGWRAHGPATPEQVKTVARLQRRRRDPNDRALLEQVAALYKANPDAPVAAISEALDMSPRTAARWAARCSEVGLLPQVSKKGQKRL